MSIESAKLDGGSVSLSTDDIKGLMQSMRGTVLMPGTPDYDAARFIWNGMIPNQSG